MTESRRSRCWLASATRLAWQRFAGWSLPRASIGFLVVFWGQQASLPVALGQLNSVAESAAPRRYVDESRELPADLTTELDVSIQAQMERDAAVGLAVAVILDGEVKHVKGYGFADRDEALHIDDRSMFRWGSVSKPLTAVAAMQLYEVGKLNLDADVRQYVPEFPDHGAKITTRDLLCHQSGIVHYRNGPVVASDRVYSQPNPFADVVIALDKFKASPLLFEPGTQYSYSTHAYILLSAVVQRAGDQKFSKQVRQRIANVSRMPTLQPDYPWVEIPGRVSGYRRVYGDIVSSDPSEVSWKLGGGGFISNIGDMARFGSALIQRKLLAPSTEYIMWTQQTTEGGKLTSYGLGFRVEGSGQDLRISHSGSQPKTRTLLVLYPRRKSGFAIATNSEWVRPKDYAPFLESIVSEP